MRLAASAGFAAWALLAGSGRAEMASPPDADHGAKIFQTICSACHSLDADRVGPRLRGVVGRPSGSVPNFRYSPALRRLGRTWTTANLELWLAGPTKLAPGAAMGVSLANPKDRADVIAYLEREGRP